MRQEVQSHAGHGGFFRQVNFSVFGLLPAVSSLNLSTADLYSEVAIIAYHFHWSRAECMAMSRKERHRWIGEIEKINKAIAHSMKPKGGSKGSRK